MKHCFAVLSVLCVLMGGMSSASAEDKPAVTKHIEPLGKATMEKLLQLQEAPEQNHILSPLVGTWHYDLNYWATEDSEPQLSSGVIVNEMVFDNRFLLSKSSVILNIGGENIGHQSWSLLGYDPAKEKFTSSLIDTHHKGMISGTATYNAERKILEEEGSFIHPLTGKEMAYRAELEFTSDDTHKRTIFIADDQGKEFKKIFELQFRRQG